MSRAAPSTGKTSYTNENGTQTNPQTAGPQKGDKELTPRPWQGVPDPPPNHDFDHAWNLNDQESSAALVGYDAGYLAKALEQICHDRGCMHTFDTTGVPTQSYLYFQPGRSTARHPITGKEVWNPGMSHITIVRIPPKPYETVAPTNGKAAASVDSRTPANVVSLFGDTLYSGSQGEKGTHLTIRSEENVLHGGQQSPNQVGATEGIPVAPVVVRQNHFARGRYILPKGTNSSDFATGVSSEEAHYRKESYKFWTSFQDVANKRGAKSNGVSDEEMQKKWNVFLEQLNVDFQYIMETWARVLQRAQVKEEGFGK